MAYLSWFVFKLLSLFNVSCYFFCGNRVRVYNFKISSTCNFTVCQRGLLMCCSHHCCLSSGWCVWTGLCASVEWRNLLLSDSLLLPRGRFVLGLVGVCTSVLSCWSGKFGGVVISLLPPLPPQILFLFCKVMVVVSTTITTSSNHANALVVVLTATSTSTNHAYIL